MKAYRISQLPPFHFTGGTPGGRLAKLLAPAGLDEIPPDSIEINLGGRFERNRDTHELGGAYKFIRWRSAVRYEGGCLTGIYFRSAGFRSFLLYRLVLLPLFWRQAAALGGTYLLGTAYRRNGQTHLLFARPGAGKTRLLLDTLAANPGVSLIGDGSLLWLPREGLLPILPELELRYRTCRDNPLWNRLDGKVKLYLQFCRAVSFLTGRRISFNAAIDPAAYGIPTAPDDTATPLVIEEVIRRIPHEMSREKAAEAILDCLASYHNCYANIFHDEPPLEKTHKNLVKLFR